MQFFIPQNEVIFEEEIKKSRFITYFRHTAGLAASKAFLAEIKALHPQARHWCWATVAGSPTDSQQYGFSDDGEPSGTAGKPMLSYLQGANVGEITAVVVRYYGGIQLGTGGLVKAYGGGVQQALLQLQTVRKVLRDFHRLQCSYEQYNHVLHWLSGWDIEIQTTTFADQIELVLGINPLELAEIEASLTERFSGALQLLEN